ncbi:hypothetical protein CRUP_033380 [Coryphaenoides rupestris]|nr:hypothetical protein CRUP_033380 [Coryphaenoides rupestris]
MNRTSAGAAGDPAPAWRHIEEGNLEELLGEAVSCLADSAKHPDAAILHRRYTLGVALFALQWPGLMLAGGALLVALVKLTQRQSLGSSPPERQRRRVHATVLRRGPSTGRRSEKIPSSSFPSFFLPSFLPLGAPEVCGADG